MCFTALRRSSRELRPRLPLPLPSPPPPRLLESIDDASAPRRPEEDDCLRLHENIWIHKTTESSPRCSAPWWRRRRRVIPPGSKLNSAAATASPRLASRRVICGEIGSSPRLLAGWSGVSACGGVSRRRGNQPCHIRGQRRHPQVNDPVGPHLSGARTSVTWMRSLLRACVRREVCGTARWTRRGWLRRRRGSERGGPRWRRRGRCGYAWGPHVSGRAARGCK